MSAQDWNALITCRTCGLLLLRGFVGIADWVVRRVEGIEFVDDRTVRRRVSVDYTVPQDAVVLRVSPDRAVRILPLALMRRKNMINFDFRDHEGRPMPLLGLRENQALTLAVVRAWAHATLDDREPCLESPDLPDEIAALLDDIVAGDQAELNAAYRSIQEHRTDSGDPIDERLTALLERLAGNFILFASEREAPGNRQIVKWTYDEPLTLLHSTSSYQGHTGGPCPPRLSEGEEPEPVTYGRTGRLQPWWRMDPLFASLGLQPTLIRFPTPGAELAASFHLEITAPPDVSIVRASMLAGTPNLRFDDARPQEDIRAWKVWRASGDDAEQVRRRRLRRRPSFDSVGGGYPTVDLHVADVPYGSLSRAQVELQAKPDGWLGSAVAATWLVTVALLLAWGANPTATSSVELSAVILITYAAAMVAVVVRPDPHMMATRLLLRLRILAAISALFALGGGAVFAYNPPGTARDGLLLLALANCVPTLVLTLAFLAARRLMVRDRPPGVKSAARRRKHAVTAPLAGPPAPGVVAGIRRRIREARAPLVSLSPWEQHLPDRDLGPHVDADSHVKLAAALDEENYPYDAAVTELGFDRPGIKVASIEGDRSSFRWTMEFDASFRGLLERQLARVTMRAAVVDPLPAGSADAVVSPPATNGHG
jgi:hypothetical protein